MTLHSLRLKAVIIIACCITSCCLITACATDTPKEETQEVAELEMPEAEAPAESDAEPAVVEETIPEETEELPLYDRKLLVVFYRSFVSGDTYTILNNTNLIMKAIEEEYHISATPAYMAYPEPEMFMRDDPEFGVQYSAMELIDDARWAFELPEDYIGTLAITAKDLYSGDPGNDFVYSKTSGNVAVISTARFTTDGGSEEVILERIVNQALKTTGILNEKYSKR